LVFGYVQRGIHDMPIAFVWFMMILTFPLGLAGVLLAGLGWPVLVQAAGGAYVPFRDELPIWLLSFLLGYWQWFVLLPRGFRYIMSRRSRSDA